MDALVGEFPDRRDDVWERRATKNSLKLSCNELERLGPTLQPVLEQLNSRAMLRFLERLTGIEHLIPDALFEGGGLHQILPGGFLKIHADFNKHPEWNLDRRLNAILFLNRDWSEEYGGHFEMWDQAMTACRRKSFRFSIGWSSSARPTRRITGIPIRYDVLRECRKKHRNVLLHQRRPDGQRTAPIRRSTSSVRDVIGPRVACTACCGTEARDRPLRDGELPITAAPSLTRINRMSTDRPPHAASNAVVPDFLILGAAKCGTTSLHGWLSQHPQVLMSSPKEPVYFELEYDGGPISTGRRILQDGTDGASRRLADGQSLFSVGAGAGERRATPTPN